MASQIPWREALLRVYSEAEEPLDVRQAVERIAALGLRDFSNAATPERTANRDLLNMSREVGTLIVRMAPGVYEYNDPDDPNPDELEEADKNLDDLESLEESQTIKVAACGLYWAKDAVTWGRGCRIMGQQVEGAAHVDFSEQQGVYLLYRGNSIVYVGRTTDSLRARLKDHASKKNKSYRWDHFSWFGFRPVYDNGALGALPEGIQAADMIAVLETVLIEALEPPINGMRGDRMGEYYIQVIDREEAGRRGIYSLQALLELAQKNM